MSTNERQEDFSLIVGGPLYQLFLRTRLARAPLDLLHRRAVVIPLLAWLPLAALTLYEGTAWSNAAPAFLYDVEAYVRFLLALPILIVAEWLVHNRLRGTVEQFLERDLVADVALDRFHDAMRRAVRLRNSVTVEVVLLVTVLVISPILWNNATLLDPNDWRVERGSATAVLSLAGWWFVHISAPIFQFILLRWYFRIVLWWIFLWRVSRLPLTLLPSHPDRAGGLGFLGGSTAAFIPVLFAQSVAASGLIFSQILAGQMSIMEFRAEIVLLVLALVAFIVLPLLFFAPVMNNARRLTLRSFGELGARYSSGFVRKWIQREGDPEPLLGSGDIQSLNDLGGAYAIVQEMKTIPIGRRAFVELVLATAAPFFPLVLTAIPFREVVNRALQMVL